MPLQENLNVAPYYADYTPLSDYYSILFKAGFPIQARELTNMQLMQQNQLEQFMSRFMKAGDTVVPGEFAYSLSAYVRVSSITQGATASEFVGYTLTGAVSGVKAVVLFATAETTEDDITFYVSYESSGTTSEYATFIEGETLESNTPNKYTAVTGVSGVSKPLQHNVLGQTLPCPALGRGSIFTVEEGSYYVDGISVRNDKQTIALDKYSTQPSYLVGFDVSEQFITSNDDSSLLDNSQGSSNFAAPGADRLKITLTLGKTTATAVNTNFIQIITLVQGNIVKEPSNQQNWAWLYDILAKRTFDESGDYILTDFPVELLQYWNSDSVNGLYNADVDGLYPPIPGTESTIKLAFTDADKNYVVKVSPGEAYVQGVNVGFERPIYVYGDKPRTQSFRANSLTTITTPFDVKLTNVFNLPDVANITGGVNTVAYDGITLYRNFIDGYVGESIKADGNPYNVGQAPAITYHVLTETDIGTISESGITGVVYKGTRGAVVQVPSDKQVVRFNGTAATGSGTTINQVGGANVLVSIVIKPSPAGVMYPRYIMPNAIVDDLVYQGDAAQEMSVVGYNSTYDMGIIKSEFFTEFAIINDTGTTLDTTAWVVGDLVFGERTRTFGTVEAESTTDLLILSNIVGEFEDGEFISQVTPSGAKIGRIAKAGDVLEFKFPSGTIDNLTTITSVTVSALGSNLTLSSSDIEADATSNTLKPTPAGRAKLRNFPFPEGSTLQKNRVDLVSTATDGSDTMVGYAEQIASKTINSLSKTKSFFSNLADTTNFSADMAIENNLSTDIASIANGALFSGVAGDNKLVCNNFSGNPSDELLYGDLVSFSDNNGIQQSHLVLFTTEPVGYGQERAKAIIYLTTPLENAVTGAVVDRIRIKTLGQPQNDLLFVLPQTTVASLQSDADKTGINYYVLQEFIQSVSAGATSVTLETNAANEFFIQGSRDAIACVVETGTAGNLEVGRQLTIFSSSVTDANRKITLTFSEGTTPIRRNCQVKIMLPVYITNAKAKIKKLSTIQTLAVSAADAAKAVISLGVTDAIMVDKVLMAPNNVDVRDNYTFDSGQRDNFYGISTLNLNAGAPAATGALTITYTYFEHSGDGDFFSVDSYINDDGVDYTLIPVYVPIAKVINNSPMASAAKYIELRDCVDFRPVVNTTGSDPSYLPTISSGKTSLGSTNFRNTSNDGNGTSPRIPLLGSNFECNLAFYQPKVDSLFIEKTGALTLVEGVPADEPVAPPDLATGIRLYDIYLPPYVFQMKDIKVEKFNYKGYRMKDIVSLERRISRLEELVTLSILEQSALNMSVRDAVTGLDRFKNGILVDPFSGHGLGDTTNNAYHCSIDQPATHLRSPFYADQIELIETVQTDTLRNANGYRKEGTQIMLNYVNEPFSENPFATRSLNLQPYSVFSYDGDLFLNPAIDTWQDITVLPDLVIEDTSLFDAMQNLSGFLEEVGMGTVWSGWETTGQTSTSVNSGIERAPGGIRRVTTTSSATELSRTQTQTVLNVQTGQTQETSYGERVTDVQLARTMRSRSVQVQGNRLKPNARYYVYFDDIDCTEWFAVDNLVTDFPDGVNRYQGVPGANSKGFGYPILTDDVGNLSGTFIIPNGRPPVQEQVYSDFAGVSYQTSGPTRSFNTGTRKFRVTTSKTDNQDLEAVDAFAETTYVASGVLLDKQETIVATTIPEMSSAENILQTQNRWQVTTTVSRGAVFDPIAQTFYVDEAVYNEGVFVTELSAFFETKDEVEGVEAYLVTTDGQIPTETVLPYSKVVKNSDTILRVKCGLGTGITSETLAAGITVTGETSGATGVLKSVITFDAASQSSTKNVNNTTYNVVLNNYVGEFFPGEVIVPSVTPASTSTFNIVDDEVQIEYAEVSAVGSSYSSGATVTFSAPQLPGGVTATGTVKVGATGSSGAGLVYGIQITEFGSGYTKTPSATISDTAGSNATVAVRTASGEKAVDMGVATSEDATVETIFRFQTPIYLLGGTTYAFVLKSPTSVKYKAYVSKMGENVIGTQNRVISQATLGSLFKSQNGGLWTEDQTQDIKFNLRRAKFSENTAASINLINFPIDARPSTTNPITTDNSTLTEAGATRFGANPKIVKVECAWHGMLPGDLVAISGVQGDVGGVPDAEVNTLHEVVDASMNDFTIQVSTDATSKARGGGSSALISVNKEYECVNVTTGAMVFGPTSLTATTTPTIGLSSSQALRAKTLTDAASLELAREKYTKERTYNIGLTETYYYSSVKTAINEINEAKYNGSDRLNGRKSLDVTIGMITTNNAVSPVINLERTNATVIRNLIDYPNPTDPIFGTSTSTIVVNGDSSTLTNITAGSALAFTNNHAQSRTVMVDAHDTVTNRITVRGEAVADLVRNPTFADAALQALGIASVSTQDGSLYYPEVNNRGSSWSKFISKLLVFENECDGIQLKLSACYYTKDSIRCYYRPRTVGFDGDVSQVNWVPFNPTQELNATIIDPDQQNILVDARQVVPGLPDDVNRITVKDSDNVSPKDFRPDSWRELVWTAQDLPKFDALAIKIVMEVDNPALAPIIDDMQIVVSE